MPWDSVLLSNNGRSVSICTPLPAQGFSLDPQIFTVQSQNHEINKSLNCFLALKFCNAVNLCKSNSNTRILDMEKLMQNEMVRAHNPKPKINDALRIHFGIICAKMPLGRQG